ncbi:hypothetical protein V6N13_135094 [Hibiscus sabdariffa]
MWSGTGSLEFLEDISSGLSYLANKELVMLRELKVEQLEFDLDLGALKQYFPVNLVPSGIFKISLDVFGKSLHAYGGLCRLHFPAGLRFEETADAEAWHCDVRVFSVFDLISGEIMGYSTSTCTQVGEKRALIVEQGREIWSDLCGSSKWFSSIQWCTTVTDISFTSPCFYAPCSTGIANFSTSERHWWRSEFAEIL